MTNNGFSRTECNALRGIAIIGIFLHNYCHWLGPIVKENEYQYFQLNVDRLAHAVQCADASLPLHLLSFFGHYGVPLFLFLSAFGLVRKYEANQQTRISTVPFVCYHFLKLFKMMIVGFVAFTMQFQPRYVYSSRQRPLRLWTGDIIRIDVGPLVSYRQKTVNTVEKTVFFLPLRSLRHHQQQSGYDITCY